MALQVNDLTIYDTHADRWWDGSVRWLRTLHNLVPARLDYFDGFVEDWSDKSVIDVGCGGGFMSEALAQRAAEVVGIDQSESAIEAARAHALSSALAVRYQVSQAEQLDFESESFDVVVCVDVLEHVDDLDRAIGEMGRILKPGGLFLFDTINRNWLASFLAVTAAERLVGLLPRGAHDPELFIRPSELRERLGLVGLDVVDLAGLGPTGLSRRLDIKFGKVPSTLIQYMGVARKQY